MKLPIKGSHLSRVVKNQHDEHVERALLCKPEPQLVTTDLNLIQNVEQKYSTAETDRKPDHQQFNHQRDVLNQIQIGGYKLGFWFAQQGSLYVFIVLIFYYARKMAALDTGVSRGRQGLADAVMDLQTLTYVVVGLTFSLYIGIAFWARAGSTKEFYVAGGDINPIHNGMATAADWMSAASFISMAGLIAFMGYGGSVFLMGWTGGYVLLALLVAPYLRQYGKFTVPEFIGDRYYSHVARAVAVLCLIICSVTYVIGQMKGVGVAFSRFFAGRLRYGFVCGHDHRAFLCGFGRHEGDHLYADRPVLRTYYGLHHSGHFY